MLKRIKASFDSAAKTAEFIQRAVSRAGKYILSLPGANLISRARGFAWIHKVHMEEFQHRYTLTLPDNLEFPWVERILRLNLGEYNLTQRLDQNMIYISMDVPLKPGHRKDFEKEGFKVTER